MPQEQAGLAALSKKPSWPTGPERAVIHLNVADFAVAVERILEPRLRERPVIVAPEGGARACVFDMSNEAYLAGVRKRMPLDRALRLVRDATLLAPHPDRYERAMRALVNLARAYTPLIEATDENGHLFLDVSGTTRLFGPPRDVAWRLRRSALGDLGFNPIWTVAPNKLLAKVASRLVKPAGEILVKAGDEAAFLMPVPVQLVPGIEADELARFREFHLQRVGDVAALTPQQLDVALGSPTRARHVYATVRGVDTTPVLPVDEKPPVVVGAHEFPADTNDAATVASALYALCERAGAELRKRGMAARRVSLRVTYTDGMQVARVASPSEATASDARLFALASEALQRAWMRRVRVRHLRMVCDRLIFPPAQLELFPDEQTSVRKNVGLDRARDAIRAKFGREALKMGRTLAP